LIEKVGGVEVNSLIVSIQSVLIAFEIREHVASAIVRIGIVSV
jgi:hypothetical protein